MQYGDLVKISTNLNNMYPFIHFAIAVLGLLNVSHPVLKSANFITYVHPTKEKTITGTRQDKLLTYETHLKGIDDFSIEIKTVYIDNKQALDYQLLGNPNQVVIKQILIFKNQGKVILEKEFAVKKKVIKLNENNLTVLDNVIIQIGIVKGKKGGFYKIDGYGGCNGCSEYWGAYSMQGKLLNESYSSRGKFDYEFGNFTKIIKEYAIDPTFVKAYELEVIWVFPPKYSGNKTKSLIR